MDPPQEEQYDVRPPKRPRNVALPEDLPPMLGSDPRVAPEEMAMRSPVTPDPSRSSRLEALPISGSPASRSLRGEEKNPRKLSCKECRRYLYPNYLFFLVAFLKYLPLRQVEIKGENTFIVSIFFGH